MIYQISFCFSEIQHFRGRKCHGSHRACFWPFWVKTSQQSNVFEVDPQGLSVSYPSGAFKST